MKELLSRRELLVKALGVVGLKTETKDQEQDRRLNGVEAGVGYLAGVIDLNAEVLNHNSAVFEARLQRIEGVLFNASKPSDNELEG